METANVEQLHYVFATSLQAFAADPTVANFGRYRVASVALDAVRETGGFTGDEVDEDAADAQQLSKNASPRTNVVEDSVRFLILIQLVIAAVTFAAYYLGR
jgi:hypothetical protein